MVSLLAQLYQYYVGPDNNWMSFVGRQENLAEDLLTALSLAGEDICERRLRGVRPRNVRAGKPEIGAKAVADPLTIERLEKTESWVLETFYA